MKKLVLATGVSILIVTSGLARPPQRPGQFSKHEASGTTQDSAVLASPCLDSLWPAYSACHTTSKISATVTSIGRIGDRVTPTFEFPVNSGIEYLFEGKLWVGGIIGEDTLVSQAGNWDYSELNGTFSWAPLGEFFPPDATEDDIRSVCPIDMTAIQGYHAEFVDTFTTGFEGLWMGHTPLNLSVVQRSYTFNASTYSSILLLDFSVTNIGPNRISKAYLGVFLDGDVTAEIDHTGYMDDLVGSLRDISTCYVIDNDGDPLGGAFVEKRSPIDALGLRPTIIYPPVTDTNFNWWTTTYQYDFGPRQKGSPQQPYREFRTGSTGSPCEDVDKYYVLSHREWDYDQLQTASIDPTDSLWLLPDQGMAADLSNGFDGKMLVSVGPVDLRPDSSVRAVFALFGGEFIHIDPSNAENLIKGDRQEYYENLHFDILRQNAARAVDLTDMIVNPTTPPTGFELVVMSADTAGFKWDPWVFPEVIGYNLYLRPVDDSFLISPNTVIPGAAPDDMGDRYCFVPAGTCNREITGLEPGQLYFAAVAHVTESGVGEHSRPIVIGDRNQALLAGQVRLKREFVFHYDDDSIAALTWEPSECNDIKYYKVYRTADSLVAFNRYYPFVSSDTALVSYEPACCIEYNGATYCLYQMQAYDSTDSNTPEYVDRHAVESAYYWVSAVVKPGFESEFSDLIRCDKTVQPTRDVVVIVGSDPNPSDYVYADSVFSFYDNLLHDLDFEIYSWWDTNGNVAYCPSGYCTDWRDLADFKLVIVEEFPRPKILGKGFEPEHKLLTRVIAAGQNLAYFGTPPGGYQIDLGGFVLQEMAYKLGSFEARYLNLDSAVIRSWYESYNSLGTPDSLAGFNGAAPETDGPPMLSFDTARDCMKPLMHAFFEADRCLPFTPAFIPNGNAQTVYRYRSLYPATSDLAGMPCGLFSQHDRSHTFAFSFHLWAMEPDSARKLIDYLMSKPPQESPPPLPRRAQLHQNYPNPFNAATSIRFYLPERSRVSLDIFNILGQRVCTLIDGQMMAGGVQHTVEWAGTAASGKPVASGVYFYRLTMDSYASTKRMVLLK